MEKDELKYNELIGFLRKKEPQPGNPEELTEQIMVSLKKKEHKATRVIILVRPWLSVAAIFLIALFIYQNNDVPVHETKTAPVAIIQEKPEQNDCLAGLRIGKINRRTLLQTYHCYQRQSERKGNSTEQLMMKYQQKF
jgi:hypothetical protein